jgi:hypothetical protein
LRGRKRIEHLEQSLPADQRIRLWLNAGHAYGSLPAYVDWLIDQPPTDHPSQIAVDIGTFRKPRRLGPYGTDPTPNPDAQRAELLRSLVIELNELVHDRLPVLAARFEGLSWRWRSVRDRANRADAADDAVGLERSSTERTDWANDAVGLWLDLATLEAVVGSIGEWHFGGEPVLWPDLAGRLAELSKVSQRWLDLASLESAATVPDGPTRQRLVDQAADDEVRSIVALCQVRVLELTEADDVVQDRISRRLRRGRDRVMTVPAQTVTEP